MFGSGTHAGRNQRGTGAPGHDAAATAGVEIVAVSGTYNMIHPDPAVRHAGHRRLAILAERCAVRCRRVSSLCTGTRDAVDQWKEHPDNNTPEAWRPCPKQWALRSKLPIATMSISVLNPNLPMSSIRPPKPGSDLTNSRALVSRSFWIQPTVRGGNAGGTADDRFSAIDLLADRIVMAHAKDRSSDGRLRRPARAFWTTTIILSFCRDRLPAA